ncbi:MAG: hypothetical protein ABSE79_14110 [Terriglobia bacterium]|jgi:hypothetical protein
MKAIKWGLRISACLILLVILDENRNDNQAAPPSPPPTAEQQQDERQRKAQQEFALTLTRAYRNQGYEVLAVPNDHTLELLSESFKDPEARNAAMEDLIKIGGHSRFCDLGIWTLAVGYEKGMLSGDVTLKRSLGCPAAKAAHLKEKEADREKFVASLVSDMSAQGVHPSAGGVAHTALVLEGNWTVEVASIGARMLLNSPTAQDLCSLGFSRVDLKSEGHLLKTVPIHCK